MSKSNDSGRRDFLKKAVVASSVTVAPGVILHTLQAQAEPRTTPVTDKVRWGMLIDTSKCAEGCKDCVEACNRENGLDLVNKPEGASEELWERQRPHWIRQVKLKDNMTGMITNLPMMCQHCEHPPCADVCPTGASFKRLPIHRGARAAWRPATSAYTGWTTVRPPRPARMLASTRQSSSVI